MATIRRSGLMFTIQPNTWWVTEDGEWEVHEARALSFC